MRLVTKSNIITISGNKRHNEKNNTDYYKISILTSDGLTGNINATQDVYDKAMKIGMGKQACLTCEYCDDYENVSFKAVGLDVLPDSKK